MTFQQLVNSLIRDTLDTSIPAFMPELVICATIVVLLIVRIITSRSAALPFALALAGSLTALWYTLPTEKAMSVAPQEIFTGMLIYDPLTVFIRALLLVFAVLFIVLSWITGIARREDAQDYFTLVLGATLGMCVMASANHLMTVFLGVEMASVPSYVLAGIVKGRSRSSEAALKYAVYGAGAAGVMLYGVSLLAGVLGSTHLPTMATQLAAMDIPAMIATGEASGTLMVMALGALMVMVGLAFKLSAVPFHFWCPDVFEGAPAEVGAFLSVASKAAALALLVRVAIGLGTATSPDIAPVTAANDAHAGGNIVLVATDSAADASPSHNAESTEQAAEVAPLHPVRSFMARLIAIVAIITCTFGNLAAYGQTNIKRMLAYSTIAHAGYMMMPVAAALVMINRDASAGDAIAAMLLYAAIYLFMNLGAFAIVAVLRNAMRSEEIADYAGLIRSAPVTTVAMVAIMFSLIGLPPLAGFIGKLFIFASLWEAGGTLMVFVLVVGGINTVLSLVYYLRVAKVMCIDAEPDSRTGVELGFLPVAYICLVTSPVLAIGILPNDLRELALSAGRGIFS